MAAHSTMDRPLYFAAVVIFLLLFSLADSQRSEIGCLSYFHAWCGLSANLECRSEMCCTWFAEKIQDAKNAQKNHHLRTIAQLCRAISSQLRHVSTIGELLEQQYLLHMSSQYGKPRPTNGWDQLVSLGHPSKFELPHFVSWLRYCTDVSQRRSTKLCTMFGHLLSYSTQYRVHNTRIYIFGGRSSLPGAKFTLRPSLAFFYIGRVTARHSSLI